MIVAEFFFPFYLQSLVSLLLHASGEFYTTFHDIGTFV